MTYPNYLRRHSIFYAFIIGWGVAGKVMDIGLGWGGRKPAEAFDHSPKTFRVFARPATTMKPSGCE